VRRLVVTVVFLVALAAPARALACSHDDSNYFETFVDATCLQAPLDNTTLDALGGLRLATNGTPASTTWDTDTDFNTGVTYQTQLFPPVGVSTLQTSGTGAAATLKLPSTPLPLTPDAADPVLGPTASTVGDGDNVDDPTVARVGTTYDMWYTGYAEDGSAPAIFLAISTDGGATWTRANGGSPVLEGTAGAFDANGVSGADVVYDPADVLAPYKMWYSGRAGAFGGIGYATSLDGLAWTKYGGATPLPVLDHGLAGSADSFSAADPSVLKDGSTWKMWYTGDDSNKKRIAYATSADGITWEKGGKVIAPEDPGVSANIQFGAFSPTVWKTSTGFSMLLTGRKLVGGGVFQTKIMETTSTDGLVWSGPSPALNPAGTNTKFDFSNLNSPDVLSDPGTASPYKLFYSGNTIDSHGNFHTRIGLATSTNGSSFNKFNGAQTGGSVFDVGTEGTAFDARQASGLSVVAPSGANPKFAGFYWGTRGSDFTPRLGEATSADGTTWTKVPVSVPDGGALFGLGNPSAFDNGGERDPSVLYDSGTYDLYFTGLDSGGKPSIGFASSPQVAGTKQPKNVWTKSGTALLSGGASGSGFDAYSVSHPSVVFDSGLSKYVMYYTGNDSATPMPSIGRATSSSANGPFAADGTAVLTHGLPGAFDEKGVEDPVVIKDTTGYRMLLTGIDADGIERIGYSTSSTGLAGSWSTPRVALDPSLTPFASDETGLEPTGMVNDSTTVHVWASGVDRTGRTRAEHFSTPLPTATGSIPSGWATYQLGSSSTTIEDFRQIVRTSTGPVALSMSFLQPYSSGGNEFWSDYFPVTMSSPSEALNFLLTVHGVRWRAQLMTPPSGASLDKVQLTYAPVSFATSGTASSDPIAAAPGRVVTAWGSLSVDTSVFSPSGSGTTGGTVQILDATSNQQLSSTALNTGGTTTVSLASVSATSHPSIKVVFALTSSGQATPLVHSFTVSYTTQAAAPGLTLLGTPLTVVFGKAVKLSGLLTQGGSPVAGQTITVAAKPLGSSGFKAFAAPTTSATGAYSTASKPKKQTTYEATATGVTAGPTVTVKVKQLLKLSVARSGGKVSFKGRLLPKKRRRVVVIQVRSGKRWKVLARVKTSKRSTFKGTRTLKPSRHGYRFRAKTKGYPGLLAGTSRTVRLRR
jgi:predicted GH43/DUF377 family glycosyl hydrolase